MQVAVQLRALLEEESYIPGAMPRELLGTNRIMWRWAASIGEGLPADEWDGPVLTRVPPLDDRTAVIVDQIIMHSPDKTRRFVKLWYKTPIPVPKIAERMCMTPKRAYQSLGVILYYLRWKFQESKYPDLVRIVNVRQ